MKNLNIKSRSIALALSIGGGALLLLLLTVIGVVLTSSPPEYQPVQDVESSYGSEVVPDFIDEADNSKSEYDNKLPNKITVERYGIPDLPFDVEEASYFGKVMDIPSLKLSSAGKPVSSINFKGYKLNFERTPPTTAADYSVLIDTNQDGFGMSCVFEHIEEFRARPSDITDLECHQQEEAARNSNKAAEYIRSSMSGSISNYECKAEEAIGSAYSCTFDLRLSFDKELPDFKNEYTENRFRLMPWISLVPSGTVNSWDKDLIFNVFLASPETLKIGVH